LSDNHKEVLRKIYCNLWENNPELKQAIENQTIRVFDVPDRDLVALYEEWWNLLYFAENNWEEYFNLEKIRSWNSSIFLNRFLERLYLIRPSKNSEWLYLLEKWEKIIENNSEEYILLILQASDLLLEFIKKLKDSQD